MGTKIVLVASRLRTCPGIPRRFDTELDARPVNDARGAKDT